MTKPKKSAVADLVRSLSAAPPLAPSGLERFVESVDQETKTITVGLRPRTCHACHNPVSAEVCAACGNKQP